MGHSGDDVVYKIPQKTIQNALAESAENFCIGLI